MQTLLGAPLRGLLERLGGIVGCLEPILGHLGAIKGHVEVIWSRRVAPGDDFEATEESLQDLLERMTPPAHPAGPPPSKSTGPGSRGRGLGRGKHLTRR